MIAEICKINSELFIYEPYLFIYLFFIYLFFYLLCRITWVWARFWHAITPFAESLSQSFNLIGVIWNLTCDDLRLDMDIHNCPPQWATLTSKFWCWKSAEKCKNISTLKFWRRIDVEIWNIILTSIFQRFLTEVEKVSKTCWKLMQKFQRPMMTYDELRLDMEFIIAPFAESHSPIFSSIGSIVNLISDLWPVMTAILTCNSLLFAESLSPSFNSIGGILNLSWPLTCDDLRLDMDIHDCPPQWAIFDVKILMLKKRWKT